MAFTWTVPPSDGGSVILDYRIEYDQSINTYTLAADGVTTLSHIQTAGISAGNLYKFKIQARNGVGLSVYSNEFEILSAVLPDAPLAPTTTVSGENIIIDWNVPSDTGGNDVIGYKIYLLEDDGSTWTADLTNCDGENDSNVIINTSCSIPKAALITAPFNLVHEDVVFAKIVAVNEVGDSNDSAPGGGAAINHGAPDAPIAPTTTLSGDNIIIDWSPPDDNGVTIDGYEIKIRHNDAVTFTTELVNCDGYDATIRVTTQCTIPYSVL